jgi:succinate dehydrogenase hydrophobic anchor subunit
MMEDKLLDARIRALWLAARTMAFVIVAITFAMIVGLFVSNDIVYNKDVFGLLSYVMTSVVGAVAGSYATLMGMKGELQIIEDDDEPEPVSPEPEAPAPDGEDMAPWEMYRNDLRYDANGDGAVTKEDFPDWRNPEA